MQAPPTLTLLLGALALKVSLKVTEYHRPTRLPISMFGKSNKPKFYISKPLQGAQYIKSKLFNATIPFESLQYVRSVALSAITHMHGLNPKGYWIYIGSESLGLTGFKSLFAHHIQWNFSRSNTDVYHGCFELVRQSLEKNPIGCQP